MQYSHVVSHHSTNCTSTSLTSGIRRDPVLSGVYGRSCEGPKTLQAYLKANFSIFFFVFAAGRSSEVVRLGAPRRLGALLFFPLTARASAAPGFSNPSNRLERPLGYGQSRLLSLAI